MAARDSEKRGQVSEINSHQTTDTASVASEPNQIGQADTAAALGADLQAHIGRQLRAVYDEVVSEAVPDRFLRLLEELERKQAPRS